MGGPAVHHSADVRSGDLAERPHPAEVQRRGRGLGDDGQRGRVQPRQAALSQAVHLRVAEGTAEAEPQHSSGIHSDTPVFRYALIVDYLFSLGRR